MVTLSGISRLVDSGAGDTAFFFFPMAGVRRPKEGKIPYIRVILVAEPLERFLGFGYVRDNEYRPVACWISCLRILVDVPWRKPSKCWRKRDGGTLLLVNEWLIRFVGPFRWSCD